MQTSWASKKEKRGTTGKAAPIATNSVAQLKRRRREEKQESENKSSQRAYRKIERMNRARRQNGDTFTQTVRQETERVATFEPRALQDAFTGMVGRKSDSIVMRETRAVKAILTRSTCQESDQATTHVDRMNEDTPENDQPLKVSCNLHRVYGQLFRGRVKD